MLRMCVPATVLLVSCSGCGLVWTFYEERFPETFSRISVVRAEDGKPLPDANVSFDLLSAQRGLEPWQATLIQEGKRIRPPRAVGPRREGPSAMAEASISTSAGGPIVVRPFPPGDPHARRVRSLKLTREPDGSLVVEPCRVLAANQVLYPFRTPHGTFIEHMHCAVVKVSAPGYADVALWYTDNGPRPGWRSDMELYRAYSMQAMRDGIDIELGVDAMPHEAGWCEVTSEKLLLFRLVKLRDNP